MFLLIMILVMTVNSSAHAQEAKSLGLEQLKQYATEHNFGIQGLQSELIENRSRSVQARSAFFPQFSLVSGPEFQFDGVMNRSEPLLYFEGKWNLFRGSKDRFGVELSQWNERISESVVRKAKFDLELEVEESFVAYLAQAAKARIHSQALEVNEKHRQMVRKRKASGMASEADLMEFELRDSFLRSEIRGVAQEQAEAKIALVRLMGANSVTFEPFGTLPHAHLTLGRDDFLTKLSATSEQVRTASFRAASGLVALKQARAAWFPTIDLEARYGRLPLELNEANPAFQGALLLKWELFSGFETRGRIAEASAKAERLESEFRQKLLLTMAEAEISYSRLMSLEERIHLEEGNEARASNYYRAVLDEYRRGIKNGSDLRLAEDTILQARVRALDLRYRFVLDKLRLQRSVGFMID